MSGIIDIVVNLYTPQEVELGQTGLDEEFKKQVRMPEKMRSGVTIPDYIKKMDQAGIERSLLIAVRAGDIRVPESFEVPYESVHKVCSEYPDRFSGQRNDQGIHCKLYEHSHKEPQKTLVL